MTRPVWCAQASWGRIVRFALRCIFLLAIVYGAILRQDGLLPELTLPAQMAQALPTSVGTRLAASVDALCRRDPSACLAQAERLRRMLASAGIDQAVAATASGGRRSRGAIAPILP